ncbi:hypothetical protein [Aquisalimonas sp.]|uniref:hypothetical protein n=1 Tax=unclassified Aquisalimonas TaxID=2644645 RepID=UPI0025BA0C9A|nr:hypothetical protein [Aquisalimonas sp.]
MRWRLLTGLIACCFSVPAVALNQSYPVVYQSPRALGMGGTDVAIGGDPDALFSNPAGLGGMQPGWQTLPLVATVGSSRRSESFIRDFRAALDEDTPEEQRTELSDLVRNYRGRNLHADGNVVPNISWRGREWAVSAAWLGTARFDGRTHQGFGDQGLISLDARTLSGPVLGVAHQSGRWSTGVAVKTLRKRRVRETYSVRELVELTEEGGDISDDVQSGHASAMDVGIQYDLAPGYHWQPRVGAVIRNVGDLDFGGAGRIPQSVAAGIAVEPPASGTARIQLSAEYADLLHDLGDDSDHLKRLRLGGQWYLWERRRHALALRAGLYQRALTAGVDLRVQMLRIGLMTYAEEQGAFAGQDSDRRYVLTVGLGL